MSFLANRNFRAKKSSLSVIGAKWRLEVNMRAPLFCIALLCVGMSTANGQSSGGLERQISADLVMNQDFTTIRIVDDNRAPIQVALFSKGRELGVEKFKDEASLASYLGHSTHYVRIVVENGASLENLWQAVKASTAAGHKFVQYKGCIPPGCGIRAGATEGQLKYNGKYLGLVELKKIVEENLQKC